MRAVYVKCLEHWGRGGWGTTQQMLVLSCSHGSWESTVDVGDCGWHNLGRVSLGVGWHLPAHSSDPKFSSFYFGVGIKREALGETNIERAGVTAESASSSSSAHEGLMKRQGFLCNHMKMFTSYGLYSWVFETPAQVERTRVSADLRPGPGTHVLPCESCPGRRPGSLLIFN